MKIITRGNKLYSILFSRCPRCHEGKVFKRKNPYNLGHMFDMHENCPHCGLRYQIEPSFFYGAMYVSYAYTVAIFVVTYLVMSAIYDPSVLDVVIALAIILVLGAPLIFRISRITWLNIFVKYEPEKRGANLK